ncbi:MAG: hypothetical protein ACI9EF_001919 [Pseudohongiellaceae bacterium]|jgi:hypothetical protein
MDVALAESSASSAIGPQKRWVRSPVYDGRPSPDTGPGRNPRVGSGRDQVTTSSDGAASRASERPPFGSENRLHGWALRILVTVTVLTSVEGAWAISLRVPLGFGSLASSWVILVVVAVLGIVLSGLVWGLCRRLWPASAQWLCALLLSPLAWLCASSLLSGNAISAVAWVGLLKVVLALVLVLGCRLAMAVIEDIAKGPTGFVRLGWTLLVVVALAGSSWADNRVFVGLYPAFHWINGALTLLAAVALAMLWVPLAVGHGIASAAGRVTSGLVLLSCALCPWWGADTDADILVSFTNGLLPKARQGAVFLADALPLNLPEGNPDQELAKIRILDRPAPPPRNLLSDAGALDSDVWLGGFSPGEAVPGSWMLSGSPAEISQPLAREGLFGLPLTASVRVRLVPNESVPFPSATVTLAIEDLARGERAERSAALSESWVHVALTLEDTSRHESVGEAPGLRDEHALEVSAMKPGQGLSWTVPVPERWLPLANNSELPGGAQPLLLLEDGQEIGPVCPMHQRIRDDGGGAYSHWSNSLIFSTPDGSDPRNNGRTYSLVDPAYLTAATLDLGLAVSLAVEGLGEQGGLIEVADLLATVKLPQDPQSLAQSLSHEFVFSPTRVGPIDRLRGATHNVILVLLDALRDDHVGPRDGEASLTPHIDAMAAAGLRFTTVYSPSDHTGRSVPSLVTGLPLQVTLDAADHQLPLPTFLERLAGVGFSTFNNGSNYILRKYRHLPISPGFGAATEGSHESKGEELADEVLAFVDSQAGAPFAVYTHWSYAHIGRSKDMPGDYAEQVRHADEKVGELMNGLKAAGVWDNTLVIVTADHGYSLGEGFRFLGAHGCGERSLRVPLVMHVPGLHEVGLQEAVPPAPIAVDEVVSLLALVPSILDLLAPADRGLMGDRSLFSLLLDENDPRRSSGGTAFSDMGFSFMTRHGAVKLAEDDSLRTAMLFDPETDPDEKSPLLDTALRIELQQLREKEWGRQARLSQALIAAQNDGLAAEVLLAFQARRGAAVDVGALLKRAWLYNNPTRQFLFEQVLFRGLRDVGAALDALVRQSFGAEDQQLLVMRAWAGSAGALEELDTRYSELAGAARLLLADLSLQLDLSAAPGLLDQIEADALFLWDEGVALESLEERRVALALTAVAASRPPEQLERVKDVSVALFNRWMVAPEPGPYFSCLRTRKFTARYLIDVFRDKPVPADLGRVDTLLRNRFFADRIPEMILQLDSDEAQAWLLNELSHWSARDEDPPGKFLTSVVPVLRKFDDAEFRRQANAVIQAQFPFIQTVEDSR